MSKARRDKRQVSRYMRQARNRRRKWNQRMADGMGVPFSPGRWSKWQQDFFATTASNRPEQGLTVDNIKKVIEILKENELPVVDGCYQFPADPSVPKEMVDQANALTRAIMARDQANKMKSIRDMTSEEITRKFGVVRPFEPQLRVLFGGCRSGKTVRRKDGDERK